MKSVKVKKRMHFYEMFVYIFHKIDPTYVVYFCDEHGSFLSNKPIEEVTCFGCNKDVRLVKNVYELVEYCEKNFDREQKIHEQKDKEAHERRMAK